MKFSVVTPSFEQAEYLRQTLTSVQQQDYDNIEHIVIDGGSVDGSKEIIAEFEDHLAYWVSESDNGQSHAINKGFQQASGDIYCWINSDDYLVPNAIQSVADYFTNHPDCQVLVGNSRKLYSPSGKWGKESRGLSGNVDEVFLDWKRRWFPQQATFWRSTLWHETGGLDESLRYTMDIDLWIRFSRLTQIHSIPLVLAVYRFHESAKCVAHPLEVVDELFEVLFRHYQAQPDKLKQGLSNLLRSMIMDSEAKSKALESSVSYRLGKIITHPWQLILGSR